MPNDCYNCPCYYEDKDMCEAFNKKAKADSGIPSWCPLRQIPDKAAEDLIKGLDAMEKMQSVEVRTVRRTE